MCLKTYTEAKARRAGSRLVTGCTGGCHFDTVRCGQGGRGLSLWWPYGLRLPDLVYILSFLFIMNITEMIGISLRIVLRCFHDLMFLLCWEIKNSWSWFLIPNGLAPNRRHAIIWTNADPIHWRIYATLGGDELSLQVIGNHVIGHAG